MEEDGFILPERITLQAGMLPEPEFSADLDTRGKLFKIFPSREDGRKVLEREDLPAFRFDDSPCRLEVFPFEMYERGLKAQFLVNIFSAGLRSFVWKTPDEPLDLER
jgi:hypothetical protein